MKLNLSPLIKALNSLDEVLKMEENPIIRDSAIQRFEYTYELCYKMLRRYLENTAASPIEIEHMGYRELIRIGAEKGLIDDPVAWFDFREKRNLTSHTYDEKKAELVYDILQDFSQKAHFLLTRLS